ncbi:iron ABC transporter permease [Affinibrenneria salicis]|uniref:Iron ABC transporter permease n=1 Tax=Affinibrenneria salicis TaxID=2590031 RepID=A0A5J5G688_9GAMM|nr:iron ABC transporter permease [Affinibrenneria salicis]KAA9002554.1 iron ABC transporter permease [Affinibrenneria salicis]KAA9003158.1 iron ABC transporter permease [Affinibrenneria salicis]
MNSRRVTLLLCLAALACVALALMSGAFSLTPAQVFYLLSAPEGRDVDPRAAIVFWQIRLPRILAALLIGAGLSGAGAAYQGMFRNPLVSPDILGVSAGAGMGASIAIWFGLPMLLIQALAFAGGLSVVAGVCAIARLAKRHDPVLSLVLIGIALGTLCGAVISLIKILSDPYTQLPSITFWLLGSLSSTTLADLRIAAPLLLGGMLPLLLLRWRMNLLSLSDDEARSMGLNVARLRLVIIVSATLMTASAVAIAGIIGWIGLVVPHICRLLTGNNYQRLLPASMGCGALLLLLTDTLARSASDIELPLGILTALIGAPFFLLLLLRGGRV